MPAPSDVTRAPQDRPTRPAAADGVDGLAAAIEGLAATLRPGILRLTRGDVEAADEVWRATVARAWRYRATLRADGSLAGWLKTMALRVWIDERARRGRGPATVDVEPAVEDAGARGVELRDEVARTLAALRPIEADVLLRLHRDEQSVAEIAAALGIPENTVKSHARRGRMRLRAGGDGGEDDGS